MKLFTEDQILDQAFRAKVIDEITATENIDRKREAKRRYDIYKDRTKQYVIENLKAEGLKPLTVAQMTNRASNISIVKKIVNKRAKAYVGGVTRSTDSESKDIQVAAIEDLLDYDSKMKKADRFRDLYKNCALYFVPETDETEGKMSLNMMTLSPWQYDVIEGATDRERAKIVIVSDYAETANTRSSAATDSQAATHNAPVASSSDNVDNIIADDANDAGADGEIRFTWWSDSYHFVTNQKGMVIAEASPDELQNPIGILPFTTIAEDQDGQFWAEGGEDLIDGAVLINTIITDMFYISKLQGYGQAIASGKNLPATLEVGPNNVLMFDYDAEAGDPKPEFQIVSSNPPIADWLKSIEQYVALLLTTNNLSTSTIKMALDSQNFASGIAMIIDMAEVSADISDNREQYLDYERRNWFIISSWINLLNSQAHGVEAVAEIGAIDLTEKVNVKFNESKVTITEKEKLENLKARKELGINEMVDLIMIDNPDMNVKQAEDKLARIMAENLNRMNNMMASAVEQSDEDDDNGETNN